MNDRECDALLRKSLMDANLQDFQEVLSQENEIRCTPRYQVQRKKLLADPLKWYRSRARPLWKKTLRSAACLLLACTLGFFTLMAASPIVRAAVVQWVQEWYETHIVYRFQGEPASEEMPEYQITELPEGFGETNRIESVGYLRVSYRNQQGEQIDLICSRMDSGKATSVSTVNMEVSEVQVNGHPGQFYHSLDPNQSSAIMWADEHSNIMFSVDAFGEKLDILHMSESVELVKIPN